MMKFETVTSHVLVFNTQEIQNLRDILETHAESLNINLSDAIFIRKILEDTAGVE